MTDDGPGKPEGKLEAIFDPFMQLRAEDVGLSDGTAVSSFADTRTADSFNGTASQSTASQRPTLRANALNWRKVVEFDGNDALLSSAANALPNTGNGLTIFLVATGDQSGTPAARAAQVGSSAGTAGRVVAADLSSETGMRFNNGAATYDANLIADDFHIFVFRVDHKTGGLAFTGEYVPVGNPSCVTFLDLARPG